jgi:hypothetical protein
MTKHLEGKWIVITGGVGGFGQRTMPSFCDRPRRTAKSLSEPLGSLLRGVGLELGLTYLKTSHGAPRGLLGHFRHI